MPQSCWVQRWSGGGQFQILLATDHVLRRDQRVRGKACRSGNNSIAHNPEFALTPSICCSRYFGRGAHHQWGDMPVSIAERRRPARSHVAKPL